MTALYIILGIAAFFTLLACLRLTLILDVEEEAAVTVKVLFLKFKLAPRKDKPKPKHFRIKAFRKRRKKEEKRYLKNKLAKARADRKKEEKNKAAEASEQKAETKSLKDNASYGIDLVKYVVLRVLKTFGRHLRVDIRRIDITVAEEDPAKTAVTFGYVCQGVAYLKEILERYLTIRYREREGVVAVRADYLSGKGRFKANLAFHIRVWQVVAVAFVALKGYLAMPKKDKPQSSEPKSENQAPSVKKENNTPA